MNGISHQVAVDIRHLKVVSVVVPIGYNIAVDSINSLIDRQTCLIGGRHEGVVLIEIQARVVVIGIYVIECTACGIGCQHIHSVLHTLYLLVHIHCARTVILGCSEAGGRALDGTIGLAASAPAVHTILKVGVGQQACHL